MTKRLLLLAMGLWIGGGLFAQRTLIYCGKLIDPKAGQVLTEMTVIVSGNTVTAVQKGYTAAAADDKVIDLKNRTVMPGLIDSHVHLEDQISANQQLKGFTLNEADIAFQVDGLCEDDADGGFHDGAGCGRDRGQYLTAECDQEGAGGRAACLYGGEDHFFDGRAWRSDAWIP